MSDGDKSADYWGYEKNSRAVNVQRMAVTIRGPRHLARQFPRQFGVHVIMVRTKSRNSKDNSPRKNLIN